MGRGSVNPKDQRCEQCPTCKLHFMDLGPHYKKKPTCYWKQRDQASQVAFGTTIPEDVVGQEELLNGRHAHDAADLGNEYHYAGQEEINIDYMNQSPVDGFYGEDPPLDGGDLDGGGNSQHAAFPSYTRYRATDTQLGSILEGSESAEIDRLVNRRLCTPSSGDNMDIDAVSSSTLPLKRNAPELTDKERIVLELLPNLSKEHRNLLISAFKDSDEVRWRSATAVEEWLASDSPVLGQPWRAIKIIEILGVPYYARQVVDIELVLQDFMSRGAAIDGPHTVRNSAGERLYGRIEFSRRIEELYVS